MIAFGSGDPPSDYGAAEVPTPCVEELVPYCVSGVAFGVNCNGVEGVVAVTERARVGAEDEVGLVAFARQEAAHPLECKRGEP